MLAIDVPDSRSRCTGRQPFAKSPRRIARRADGSWRRYEDSKNRRISAFVSSNLRIFDVSRRHGVATQQRQYAILAYRNELLHCPRMSPDAPAHATALTHGRRIGPWTCPGCRESRDTVFCGVCGEKRLDHHDLTIAGLAEHAIESLTHLDGRVFRNLRDLVVRPGTLTAAY